MDQEWHCISKLLLCCLYCHLYLSTWILPLTLINNDDEVISLPLFSRKEKEREGEGAQLKNTAIQLFIFLSISWHILSIRTWEQVKHWYDYPSFFKRMNTCASQSRMFTTGESVARTTLVHRSHQNSQRIVLVPCSSFDAKSYKFIKYINNNNKKTFNSVIT